MAGGNRGNGSGSEPSRRGGARRHEAARRAGAKGVLAAATQDFVDRVRPLYPYDWLTLVRTAQSLTNARIEDYVAALAADGPLVADEDGAKK